MSVQPTISGGRTPPHSSEAEEYLLSCCLMDNGVSLAKSMAEQITDRHFFVHANQVIFSVLTEMLGKGLTIDLPTLSQELVTQKKLELVGGYPLLLKITDLVPSTAQCGYFIEKVKECHSLRQLILQGTALVELAYEYKGGGIGENISPVVDRIVAASTGASIVAEPTWKEVVEMAEKDLQTLLETKGMPPESIIEFPWPYMNELFAPMQRGQLITIGARSSCGKSSVARQILAHAALNGFKGYFVTLEVKPNRVPLQIAASIARVGLRAVAKAPKETQQELVDALSSLKGMGITISSKDRSISRLAARARALKAKGQLDIMFVDHGGYVDEVAGSSKDEKVGNCGRLSKTLKGLATELDIVVVMLWQLSRKSVDDGNREPRVSDLRDSGSIEEDSDKVLLIFRPAVNPITRSNQPDTSTVQDVPWFYQEIIQAKGRDDGTTKMPFMFDRSTATFNAVDRNKPHQAHLAGMKGEPVVGSF